MSVIDNYIVKSEVIETEFKVNQGVVKSSGFFKELSTFLIHVVVAQVQTQQMLVLV